jgi:Bifunctional DNA primase/polymerase, N-terminal
VNRDRIGLGSFDRLALVLDAALMYASRGWPVLPVKPTCEKRPLIQDWPHRATTDAVQIQESWVRWPDANIGVLTDGLVVLDIDNHDGLHAGLASLQEFGELPVTPTATTPSGGMHLYFAGRGKSRVGIKPGLDIRANRGFVVAPPSTDDRGAYV